jgi:hypothetical protein
MKPLPRLDAEAEGSITAQSNGIEGAISTKNPQVNPIARHRPGCSRTAGEIMDYLPPPTP